jgi:uncharacterized Zn finger protein
MAFYWRPYVPVARRRAQAMRKIENLKKKGVVIQPIEIEGRKIATSFWGKAWCDHLESFSDYDNRLPRGRTYVRNGSVCHLEIKKGRIEAIVSGSELYNVAIDIQPLKPTLWKSIKGLCSGKIGSMLELLQGRLSDHVMGIVTDRQKGLMPLPREIKLKCSCPDWAVMCKHVAAVMYGIGSRLDTLPELLFTLRGVDATELISADISFPASDAAAGKTIADDQLSDIFGIEMDEGVVSDTLPTKERIKMTSRRSLRKKTSLKPTTTPTTPKADVKRVAAKKNSRRQNPKLVSPRASKTAKKTSPPIDLEHPTALAIITLQTELGLSVAEFAARLGISPETVYNWQKTKGKLNLQRRSLEALAKLQSERS